MTKPTKLPLFNHLIQVLEGHEQEIEGIPVSDQETAPFLEIHADNVHVCDGVKHRAIPINAYRDWLVAHKDEEDYIEGVVLLFHNRNITVNKRALRDGVTDPRQLFQVGHVDAFIQRDGDGANIVPLSLKDVACIIYDHHRFKRGKPMPHGLAGGVHSERALAGLDDFLENVIGIKANHAVLRQRGHKLHLTQGGEGGGES